MPDVLKTYFNPKKEYLFKYISLIGLAPISLYQLLMDYEGDIETLINENKLNKFEVNDCLEQLQGAKLVQSILVRKKIIFQLFPPVKLPISKNKKIKYLKNLKLNVIEGTNISKTNVEIFGTSSKTNDNEYSEPWTLFFEKTFKAKIDPITLMQINKYQEELKLTDEIINSALYKTFVVCKNYKANYLTKCLQTLSKLKITKTIDAIKFFDGELFFSTEETNKQLQILKKELENLEW